MSFASCKKKDVYLGSPPTVTLKTGTEYVANNAIVHVGDTITIGVTASSNSSPDKLRRLVIRRSINSQEISTIKEMDIPSDQNEEYSTDIKFLIATEGLQLYKFIAVNTHGLEGEVSIQFTVAP